MTKPTDDMSDQRLRDGLKSGEFEGRNELIAEEILRRRYRRSCPKRSVRYYWRFDDSLMAMV